MSNRFYLIVMFVVIVIIWLLSIPRYIWAVLTNTNRATLILIAYDQLANTLFNGDPDETISSRAGKAELVGKRWGCILCKLLNKVDPGHCEKSIEYDRGNRV